MYPAMVQPHERIDQYHGAAVSNLGHWRFKLLLPRRPGYRHRADIHRACQSFPSRRRSNGPVLRTFLHGITGDTQQVVVAALAAQGSDNLSSVSLLKYNDQLAQTAYDFFFNLPIPAARARSASCAAQRQSRSQLGKPRIRCSGRKFH